METATPHALLPTSYRFTLFRRGDHARGVAQLAADVTARVLRVSPLDESLEEIPGVAAVPTLILELAPDTNLSAEGPLFGGRLNNSDIEIIVAAERGGRKEPIFAGALAADPEYTEACDERSLRLRFQGRLGTLWDDEALTLERDGRVLAWGHVTDDLLPALLAAGVTPPPECDATPPVLRATRPFWSYYGRPADLVPGYEDAPPRGLAYDTKRGLLYLGVGPFIRSFDPGRRVWDTVARVAYTGRSPRPCAVTWRVAHLEYDASGDRVLGIAESEDDDVTALRNHLKGVFTVAL